MGVAIKDKDTVKTLPLFFVGQRIVVVEEFVPFEAPNKIEIIGEVLEIVRLLFKLILDAVSYF